MLDQIDLTRRRPLPDDSTQVFTELLEARTSAFEVTNVHDLASRTGHLKPNPRGDNAPLLSYEFDMSLFPNVAPPYRSYWMEWADVKEGRIGCWCLVTDGTDDQEWEVSVCVWLGDRKPAVAGRSAFRCSKLDGSNLRESRPMTVFPEAFSRRRDHPRLDRATNSDVEADRVLAELEAIPDHQVREASLRAQRAVWQEDAEKSEAHVKDLMEQVVVVEAAMLRLLVYPTLFLSHSLLACRNVTTDEHRPQAKVDRAHRRRHGRGKVTFRTLAIRVAGGAQDEQRRIGLGDGQTALHLVRGHFKTFTADRPLFGSRVGTWWWSPIARGTEDAGVVIKDYKVQAGVN